GATGQVEEPPWIVHRRRLSDHLQQLGALGAQGTGIVGRLGHRSKARGFRPCSIEPEGAWHATVGTTRGGASMQMRRPSAVHWQFSDGESDDQRCWSNPPWPPPGPPCWPGPPG